MWNVETTALLYDFIVKQKLTYSQAASKLGVSPSACKRKFKRVDWAAFLKIKQNPQAALPSLRKGEWTDADRIRLHAMRTESTPPKSYLDIAKVLKRTPTACERTFQTTMWDEFFAKLEKQQDSPKLAQEHQEPEMELLPPKQLTESLVEWLVAMSRCNVSRLEEITHHELMMKTGLEREQLPMEFKKIKELAKQRLGALGYNYPEELTLKEGVYVVFGDSHGKHTKRGMFAMLKNLCKHVKATNAIHIGHALDDDGDLSYCWEQIENLIILAKREELQSLMTENFTYDLARSKIHLGKLTLSNQDYILDYSQSFLGILKRNHFEDSTIVNLHRQELTTRTTGGQDKDRVQIASPGCLCEPHIVKAIRSIDFAEGKSVKVAFPDTFIKYRRADDHSKKNWEQGVIVVKVDKDGHFDFIQCRIFQTSDGYTTSYFDKIITEKGVQEPDQKVFFNGDAHCHNHDAAVFDIQEQFCNDYKPETVVNLGDLIDNRACNHHQMERNGWNMGSEDVLDEMASAHYVLKRMSGWGKKLYLLLGNHERFAKDIADKLPQFKRLFDNRFMLGLDALDADTTDFKKVLRICQVQFNHGDMKMYGAKGGMKVEKIFNTFGRNSIVGHLHCPTIRNSCYMVGLSGELDQEYNEPEASSWMHGFGHVNVYDGVAFVSLINIREHRTWVGGKYYLPKNESSWATPEYQVSLSFKFE